MSAGCAAGSPFPPALLPAHVTILSYGALVSEQSARLTFPALTRFRHVRVKHMRRVFAHPHLFLLSQGLIDPSSNLELASLSAEHHQGASFVAVAFEVALDDDQRAAFIAREPEYLITTCPFWTLGSQAATNQAHGDDHEDDDDEPEGTGVICAANRDDDLAEDLSARHRGHLPSVWHWPEDSGLLPADVYLRHCLLAMQKAGGAAEHSFLHDTLLADRRTTLSKYLERDGVRRRVMDSRPPQELMQRFSG